MEQVGYGEDEVGCGALLFDLSIEAGGEGDRRAGGGIYLVGDDGACGAEGVEAFASGPLPVGFLNVAGGNVVDDGVAAYVEAGVVGEVEIAAAAAYDDGQFALVVDAVREGGHADDAVGGEDGGWRLEEEEGFFGDFVAELGGVVAVVAAYAEDFGRGDRGQEVEFGQGLGAKAGRREGLCGDLRGEVFFGGVHGGDGPEGVFALLDDGVAGDRDSVFEGEEFAVTHRITPF